MHRVQYFSVKNKDLGAFLMIFDDFLEFSKITIWTRKIKVAKSILEWFEWVQCECGYARVSGSRFQAPTHALDVIESFLSRFINFYF